jgi:DNA-directed RNA polymerase
MGYTDEQIKEQLILEQEMLALGADAYDTRLRLNKQKRRESLSPPGNKLAAAGVGKLCDAIEALLDHLENGKAYKWAAYLHPLKELTAEQIAGTTMRVALDKISQHRKANAMALEIGAALWAEAMLGKAGHFDLVDHLAVKRWRNKSEKRADILQMETTTIWSLRERQSIGLVLLQLLVFHTGIVQLTTVQQGLKRTRIASITPEAFEWLETGHAKHRLLCPMRLPMLIKPQPWTNLHNGGYLTDIPGNTLIKDAKASRDHTTGKEPFLQAANLQQEVGWQINRWLLEQANHAWSQGLGIGSMVPSQGYEMPPFPKHLPPTHVDVTQWKHNARVIHEKNDAEKSQRVQILKALWVADRFKNREAFYFPMQVDFRGRFYYRCYHLNPQGHDLSRALLQFAEGERIVDDQALSWLKVHGANTYGHGKFSWSDRIAWVDENEEAILAAGSDPWGPSSVWWQGAKSPWQFLAFCRSYRQFTVNGWGYISRLPVQLDCTCSGIQHFAALLRDEDMAGMVNLMPSEEPMDIYTELTNRVLALLRNSSESYAAMWLELGPDRSLTKPIVMTLAYSATRRSMMRHCQEWSHERGMQLNGMESWPFKAGGLKACYWMADLLYSEATKLIQPAQSTMAWFKKLGSAAGKLDTELMWTSPSGLNVYQNYPRYTATSINLRTLSPVMHFIGKVYDNVDGLDQRRMANSLSANVIHSLDSGHMALTLCNASRVIKNFGGIHDCFLTTAAEMATLRQVVRATFAEMYADDPLADITEQLAGQIPVQAYSKLPPLPRLGNFDIDQVNDADYFIS